MNKQINKCGSNLNEMYFKMIKDLYFNGQTISPRGFPVKEIRNYKFILDDITDNVITLPKVKTNLVYAKKELEWYLSGTNRIDYDPLIQKIWQKYSDDGNHVNSCYGYRIFGYHKDFINQWEWIKQELKKDPDSRRAVINLNDVDDKITETKDFVCTMHIQIFIRDNKLYWTVVMRSNDVYFGFRNDLYCFTSLQRKMADELNLEYGDYTHFVGSMHLYEKDFKKVKTLINRINPHWIGGIG